MTASAQRKGQSISSVVLELILISFNWRAHPANKTQDLIVKVAELQGRHDSQY